MATYRSIPPELEEEMKKSIEENPAGIDPQLLEYALNTFPNLKNSLISKNNQLIKNPLLDSSNKLVQQEAILQDKLKKSPAKKSSTTEDNISEIDRTPIKQALGKLDEWALDTDYAKRARKDKAEAEYQDQLKRVKSGDVGIAPLPEGIEDTPEDLVKYAADRKLAKQNKIDQEIEAEKQRLKGLEKYPPIPQDEEPTEQQKYADIEKHGLKTVPDSIEEQVQHIAEQSEQHEGIPTPVAKEKKETAQKPSLEKLALPETDIESLIKQSDKAEKDIEFQKQLAKTRDAIMGAGLGRQLQGDYSMYDQMAKQAKKPIENMLLKQELEDKKAKTDPNSSISKLARKFLNISELEKVPYSQLEKLYPALTQILSTKLAAEARKEEAIANRLYREEARQQAKDARQQQLDEKKYAQLYTKTNKITESDSFSTYQKSIGINKLIDSALESWNKSGEAYKIKSSASFMGYAKIAQQDDSVVRSSDMSVLAGGTNFGSLGSLIDKFAAKAAGSSFSPRELQEFKAVIKTIQDVKRKELTQKLGPILKKADQDKIDPDLLIDPEVLQDLTEGSQSPQDKLKQLEKKLQENQLANQSKIDELMKKKEMK